MLQSRLGADIRSMREPALYSALHPRRLVQVLARTLALDWTKTLVTTKTWWEYWQNSYLSSAMTAPWCQRISRHEGLYTQKDRKWSFKSISITSAFEFTLFSVLHKWHIKEYRCISYSGNTIVSMWPASVIYLDFFCLDCLFCFCFCCCFYL